jgi:hypothetical protein
MKSLPAVVLVVALSTNSFAGGIQERDFRWNDPSGKAHTQMMAAGSLGLCGWLHLLTVKDRKGKQILTRRQAILATLVTGMSIGLTKEMFDAQAGGTGFSANDMYHNVLGSAAGLTPFVLTMRF